MGRQLASWDNVLVVISSDQKTMFICGNNTQGHLPGPRGQIQSFVPTPIFSESMPRWEIQQVYAGSDTDSNSKLYLLATLEGQSDVFTYTRGVGFQSITQRALGKIAAFAQYENYFALLNHKHELFVNRAGLDDYNFVTGQERGSFVQINYPLEFGNATHIEFTDYCLFIGTDSGVVLAKKIRTDIKTAFDGDIPIGPRRDDWYELCHLKQTKIKALQAHGTKIFVLYENGESYTNDFGLPAMIGTREIAYSSIGCVAVDSNYSLTATGFSAKPLQSSAAEASSSALADPIKAAYKFELASERDFIAVLTRQRGRDLQLYVTGSFVGKIAGRAVRQGEFITVEFSATNDVKFVAPRAPSPVHTTTSSAGRARSASVISAMSGMSLPGGTKWDGASFASIPSMTRFLAGSGAAAAAVQRSVTPPLGATLLAVASESAGASAASSARSPSPAPGAALDVDALSTENSIAVWDNAVAVIAHSERNYLFIKNHQATDFPNLRVNANGMVDMRYGTIQGIYGATDAINHKALFVLINHDSKQYLLFSGVNPENYFIDGEATDFPINGSVFKLVGTFDSGFIKAVTISGRFVALLDSEHRVSCNYWLAKQLLIRQAAFLVPKLYNQPFYRVPLNPALNQYGNITHIALHSKKVTAAEAISEDYSLEQGSLFIGTENSFLIQYFLGTPGLHSTGLPASIQSLQANAQGAYALLINGGIYSLSEKRIVNTGKLLEPYDAYTSRMHLPDFVTVKDRVVHGPHEIILDGTDGLWVSNGLISIFDLAEKVKKVQFSEARLPTQYDRERNAYTLPVNVSAQGPFQSIDFSEQYIVLLSETRNLFIYCEGLPPEFLSPKLPGVTKVRLTPMIAFQERFNWHTLVIPNDAERETFIKIIEQKYIEEQQQSETSHYAVGPTGLTWLTNDRQLCALGRRESYLLTGLNSDSAYISHSLSFPMIYNSSMKLLDISAGPNYLVTLFKMPDGQRKGHITGDFRDAAQLGTWDYADLGKGWHTLF